MTNNACAHILKCFLSLLTVYAIALPVPGQTLNESQTVPDSRFINTLLNGKFTNLVVGPVVVTATAATPGPVDYATLKAAFDAINAGSHQGTITISVVSDTTEAASAVLNASGTGSSSYSSVSITPSGVRVIGGSIFGAPLIDLNGADNVNINGLNASGNSLTIANNAFDNSPPISTIRFINGAQNNLVTNCTILGSASTALGVGGGTIFFSTTTTVGNSNNTVSHNNIGPGPSGTPIKVIEAIGTTTNAGTLNTANVIDSNNIFDFFANTDTTGIDIRSGNRNWTISNNRIFQTTPRTFASNAIYSGITINGATGGSGDFHTISGNIIGFANANGTGTTTLSGSTNQFRGINILAAGSGTPTVIQNNTISAIDQTTSFNGGFSGAAGFIGIEIAASALCNTSGNTIGSLNGSSTIAVHDPNATSSWLVIGIRGSTTGDTISGNNVGAVSIDGLATNNIGFRGIQYESAGGSGLSITNNTIGGPTAGAITNTMTGSFTNYEMYGILANNSDPTITGNTVQNISSNQAATTYGILVTANNAIGTTVSRNVIHSLTGSNVYGMSPQLGVPASGTNRIERNLIHSLKSTGTNKQIFGMYLPGNANMIVANNMIRLGIDPSGASITTPEDMHGIQDQNGGIREYYFNSIYIGGSVSGANNDTFAFGSFSTGTRIFKDNIFWNARTNTSGTSHNYAFRAATNAGLTTDFNDLYATGTNGVVGSYNGIDRVTLADWRAGTLQDANSISADPMFLNPTANAAAADLHISLVSPCVGAGTAIASVGVDYDGDLRVWSNDIGADVPVGPTAAPVSIAGRVSTSTGASISNASMTLQSGSGELRSARSNSFGIYRFDDIEVGQTYILTIKAKGYSFAQPTRVVFVVDEVLGFDFVAQP